jgi:hypothetical protein
MKDKYRQFVEIGKLLVQKILDEPDGPGYRCETYDKQKSHEQPEPAGGPKGVITFVDPVRRRFLPMSPFSTNVVYCRYHNAHQQAADQ